MTRSYSPAAGSRALLVLAFTCTGCFPEQAGYAEVQSLSNGLSHVHANWDAASSGPSENDLRELLNGPLTADRSIQLAVWLSPVIQGAFVDLGVSRAELLRAYRPANPTVDAALHFGTHGPSIELHALQDLSSLLLLPFRAGVAASSAKAARLQAVERITNHLYFIRASYIEYVAAEDLYTRETALRDTAQAAAEAAQALFSAGNLTELALLRELAQQEESGLELNQAAAEVATKRQLFAEAVGLWRTQFTWAVPKALPSRYPDPAAGKPAPVQLEQQALAANLRLQAIRLRYESAARTANLDAVRGWLPQVAAGVSAEHDDAGWSLGPAAAVTLPLFDQGQANVAESRTRAFQQRQLAIETAARIRSQSRLVSLRLRAAETRAARIEQHLLPMREKLLDATLRESNAMLASVFQLLQAKREQLEATKLQVRALREYWLAYWQVQQLLAGGLPGGEIQIQATGDAGRAARGAETPAAH